MIEKIFSCDKFLVKVGKIMMYITFKESLRLFGSEETNREDILDEMIDEFKKKKNDRRFMEKLKMKIENDEIFRDVLIGMIEETKK